MIGSAQTSGARKERPLARQIYRASSFTANLPPRALSKHSVALGLLAVVAILIGPLSTSVEALIPNECAGNVTKPFAVCCPRHYKNGQVCGGHGHGVCTKIAAPKEDVPALFHIDDRISWPTRFFSHACQCFGNRFGVACEDCWFGWTGHNCEKRKIHVRKDIRRMTDREREIFIDVIYRSQTWPSGYKILDESTNWRSDPLHHPILMDASVQYFITFIHSYSSRTTLFKNVDDCNMYGILNFSHDGVTFPTWHRYLLSLWENMLARIAHKVYGVTDFAAPYWDWIGMKECDICTNKYIGAPGFRDEHGLRIDEHHPFHNLTEFCYEPNHGMLCYGCQKSGLMGKIAREWNSLDFPEQKDIEFILSREKYFVLGERDSTRCDSFHMALEGFCGRPGVDGEQLWTHNKIHNMLDGSMCCGATATNDPIFLLHHVLMDKIFSLWFAKNKVSLHEYPDKDVRPGHCRDCFLIGFLPPVRHSDMFVHNLDMGYTYDTEILADHAQNGKPPIYV